MSDAVIVVLAILTLFHIVSSIWNYKSLKELKKKTFHTNEQLNDSKYYELKSKHEFTIAVISIVTASLVFLGYNSIQSLHDKLKSDYEKKVEIANAKLLNAENKLNIISGGIDEKFKSIDTSMQNYQRLLSYFKNQQTNINNEAEKTQLNLIQTQTRIKELNKKNILKQNIYIVEKVPYPIAFDKDSMPIFDWHKVYFKDLKTILNDKLPEFKKSPFIVSAVSNDGSNATIRNVTPVSFEMGIFQTFLNENSPAVEKSNKSLKLFTIMISEIPD